MEQKAQINKYITNGIKRYKKKAPKTSLKKKFKTF